MICKRMIIAAPAIACLITICSTANSAPPPLPGITEKEAPAGNVPDRPVRDAIGKPQAAIAAPGVPVGKPAPIPFCATCIRTEQRTVLVPKWDLETKKIPTTEIRHEVREREITVMKTVPEIVERTRTITVMEPQVRSHEETYTVPKTVTRNVEEKYTVEVPHTEMRTGTRMVPKPVWKEVKREYTVKVPYTEKRTGMRTVIRCVPVTHTRTVCVDEGRWEERTACAICNPCADRPPVPVAVCKKRIWVPNLVKKQVPYTVEETQKVEIPYEYEVTLVRPEVRTRTEKVREIVPTPETYEYPVCLHRTETRTKTVQVCEVVPEKRTRTVSETILVPRQKTETYTETICRHVPEKKVIKESVCVPVPATREVQVPVRRLVPKTVEVAVAVQPIRVVRPVVKCADCEPAK